MIAAIMIIADTIDKIVGRHDKEIAAWSDPTHEVDFGADVEKRAIAFVDGAAVEVVVRKRAYHKRRSGTTHEVDLGADVEKRAVAFVDGAVVVCKREYKYA